MKHQLLFSLGVILIISSCKEKETEVPVFIEEGKYKLVWNDEFSVDGRPDSTKWSYEHGFVRNEELQWYQPQNARCEGGKLIIEGRRENVVNPNFDSLSDHWKMSRPVAQYTSSSLNSSGKMAFRYGILEVCAKVDTSMGMWPAIWTLGVKNPWPANGEIDIMEFYRSDGKAVILANAAWVDSQNNALWDSEKIDLRHFLDKNKNWPDEFHVWKMNWTDESIELFLDDELLNTIELSKTLNPDGFNPFKQAHYVLLNLALGSNGGDPSGTHFPKTYEVDYVRVYQEVSAP